MLLFNFFFLASPKTSIDKETAVKQIRSKAGRIADTLTKQEVGILLCSLSLVDVMALFVVIVLSWHHMFIISQEFIRKNTQPLKTT